MTARARSAALAAAIVRASPRSVSLLGRYAPVLLPARAARRNARLLHTVTPRSGVRPPSPQPPPPPSLHGACKCGKTGWKAVGPSAMNFVCHCSICRASTKAVATAAAGFKDNQVRPTVPRHRKRVLALKPGADRMVWRGELGKDHTSEFAQCAPLLPQVCPAREDACACAATCVLIVARRTWARTLRVRSASLHCR